MAKVITSIVPTTEQDAINVILGAIGEAPIDVSTDLSTLETTDANVQMAVTLLREAAREVLTAGWRFNTLTGFEIIKSGTFNWTDTAGVVTSLNVYKLPTTPRPLAWKQTLCNENRNIELVERPSLKWDGSGNTAGNVLVLFDRVKNRDGVDASIYPHIYLDLVTACDFEQMPESARRVATVAAAIRISERLAANESEAQFSERDLSQALRVLKREQGLKQDLNLFQTGDSIEIAGRRWLLGGGGYQTQVFPGGN